MRVFFYQITGSQYYFFVFFAMSIAFVLYYKGFMQTIVDMDSHNANYSLYR